MAYIDNVVVAIFTWKSDKMFGKNTNFVSDFRNEKELKKWIIDRKDRIYGVSHTLPGDFKSIKEVDEFKAYLRGLLQIDAGPNWDWTDSNNHDPRWNYYADLWEEMFIYNEDAKQNTVDALLEDLK